MWEIRRLELSLALARKGPNKRVNYLAEIIIAVPGGVHSSSLISFLFGWVIDLGVFYSFRDVVDAVLLKFFQEVTDLNVKINALLINAETSPTLKTEAQKGNLIS